MRRLTLAMLVLTFLVIVLGAYTRLADAGLGCPDWPGCYGQLVVPNTDEQIARAQQAYPQSEFNRQKAWIEMIHRLAAGSLGLLILIATLIDWSRARRAGGRISRLLLALCLAVVLQGLFGAWTVTLKLLPQVVVAHLFGGFFIFSLVYLRYLALSAVHPNPGPNTNHLGLMRAAVGLGLVLLIIQILLGGWISANYAARACVDFPLCGGSWVPPRMDFTTGFNFWQPLGPNYEGGVLPQAAQVAIHFTHRVAAIFLLVYWVLFYLAARRVSFVKHSMHMFLGLLLLQMALGITNVLGDLPLLVAVAHNGLAAILLLVALRLFSLLAPGRGGLRP